MAASSLSVVSNASRLRRWHTAPLPPAESAHVQPWVESAADRRPAAAATGPQPHHPTMSPAPAHQHDGDEHAVDPLCGMRVEQATAPEHRQTNTGTYSFCSAHCAATFDANPDRYTTPASGGPHEGGEPR